MNDIAIKVEELGKRYRIGSRAKESGTRLQRLKHMALAPFDYLLSALREPDAEEIIWALSDVSFEVKKGQVLGIIGHNGAGKSTLLKILSRITEPTVGRVEAFGRVASLLEVGTGFHPELTGRENVYMSGAILGMRRAEINRKFDEIVDFSGVGKFIDTPVKRYSSGMYVRLAFAVAAFLETEIVLFDEVLAVGDAEFQKRCLGKMEDVAVAGRTVLFVSHNIPAIRSMCKRAIWLEHGQLKIDGDVSSVVQRYLTEDNFSESYKAWPEEQRPGNHSFKLISVRLLNTYGSEISSIHISEDAVVAIAYEVVEDNTHVGFSLVLFDSDWNCLFGSLSNSEDRFYGKPMKCGQYVSTCRIFGNLLNSGRFYISIIGFSAHWSDGFRADRAIAFDAIDDGILRGDYYGNYSGPLRPKLKWETAIFD